MCFALLFANSHWLMSFIHSAINILLCSVCESFLHYVYRKRQTLPHDWNIAWERCRCSSQDYWPEFLFGSWMNAHWVEIVWDWRVQLIRSRFLSHMLGSKWVSERANVRSGAREQSERCGTMSEWWERMSERTCEQANFLRVNVIYFLPIVECDLMLFENEKYWNIETRGYWATQKFHGAMFMFVVITNLLLWRLTPSNIVTCFLSISNSV